MPFSSEKNLRLLEGCCCFCLHSMYSRSVKIMMVNGTFNHCYRNRLLSNKPQIENISVRFTFAYELKGRTVWLGVFDTSELNQDF